MDQNMLYNIHEDSNEIEKSDNENSLDDIEDYAFINYIETTVENTQSNENEDDVYVQYY
jgi:hypothetical protein